jgi:ABC-type uncharacterized transport system permease subunit
MTALYLGIGLLAFWLQDVSPVYWVWQKLMFVLGGLMLPLDLYPSVVQRAAEFTPFPVLLAGPASFVVGTGRVTPGMLTRDLVRCDGRRGVVDVSPRDAPLTINGG